MATPNVEALHILIEQTVHVDGPLGKTTAPGLNALLHRLTTDLAAESALPANQAAALAAAQQPSATNPVITRSDLVTSTAGLAPSLALRWATLLHKEPDGDGAYPAPPATSTLNKLRVRFVGDVSGYAGRNPELWLFRYAGNTRRKKQANDTVIRTHVSGWRHPPHGDGSRHLFMAYWGGAGSGAATEFFGAPVQAAVASNGYYDLTIEAGQWFESPADVDPGTPLRALRRKGCSVTMRLALVVADSTAPGGRRIGPLSEPFRIRSTGSSFIIQPEPVVWRHRVVDRN